MHGCESMGGATAVWGREVTLQEVGWRVMQMGGRGWGDKGGA